MLCRAVADVGLRGVDILVNAFWPQFTHAVFTRLAFIFAPGVADVFHRVRRTKAVVVVVARLGDSNQAKRERRMLLGWLRERDRERSDTDARQRDSEKERETRWGQRQRRDRQRGREG